MGRSLFPGFLLSQNSSLGVILAIACAGDLFFWWKLQQKEERVDTLTGVVDSLQTTLQQKNAEVAELRGVPISAVQQAAVPGTAESPSDPSRIVFGDIVMAEGIRPPAALARFIPFSENDRNSFGAKLAAAILDQGGVIESGKPLLTATVYQIRDDAKGKHFVGAVSSLPLAGDQYTATFEATSVSSMTAACTTIAQEIMALFARQRESRIAGALRSVSLGPIIMETGAEGADIFQAATRQELLLAGARYGAGPSLIGYGEFRGKSLSLSVFGRTGSRVSPALPVSVACGGPIDCGSKVGLAIKKKIANSRADD